MSGINKRIRRNKNKKTNKPIKDLKKTNPMVGVYIETVMKSIVNYKKQNITLYSYNRTYAKNPQEILIMFNVYITKLILETIGQGANVYEFDDLFGEIIKNKSSTMLLDYTVVDDRILLEDELVGFNIAELLFDDYIIYFAGRNLFFEDIKTNNKYFYSRKIIEKEVA